MLSTALHTRPAARLLLTVVLLATAIPLRGDQLPDELTLNYKVSLGSAELGSLSTTLRRLGETYEVATRTRAEGVASILLGGDIREHCTFAVRAKRVRTLKYQVTREGRKGFQHDVAFDWNAGTVRFSNGDVLPLPEGYTLDNCSVPFAFMVGAPSSFANGIMNIVGGERIRRFTNASVTEERLSTPIGVLDSVRIEQRRYDKPKRTFTVWVAPSRGNLPVKIVERRPSRVTTMLLTSVSGL